MSYSDSDDARTHYRLRQPWTNDGIATVIAQHFQRGDMEAWLVLDDSARSQVLVLLFRSPHSMRALEEELSEMRPAGIDLQLLLVRPDIDRDAIDSVWRLGGLDGLRKALGI